MAFAEPPVAAGAGLLWAASEAEQWLDYVGEVRAFAVAFQRGPTVQKWDARLPQGRPGIRGVQGIEAAMVERADRPAPQVWKQVVSVIDARTTVVCLHAAGMTRAAGLPFETIAGTFQNPPFHRHCRSLVMPYMPGFAQPERMLANRELMKRPLEERRLGQDPAGTRIVGGYIPPPVTINPPIGGAPRIIRPPRKVVPKRRASALLGDDALLARVYPNIFGDPDFHEQWLSRQIRRGGNRTSAEVDWEAFRADKLKQARAIERGGPSPPSRKVIRTTDPHFPAGFAASDLPMMDDHAAFVWDQMRHGLSRQEAEDLWGDPLAARFRSVRLREIRRAAPERAVISSPGPSPPRRISPVSHPPPGMETARAEVRRYMPHASDDVREWAAFAQAGGNLDEIPDRYLHEIFTGLDRHGRFEIKDVPHGGVSDSVKVVDRQTGDWFVVKRQQRKYRGTFDMEPQNEDLAQQAAKAMGVPSPRMRYASSFRDGQQQWMLIQNVGDMKRHAGWDVEGPWSGMVGPFGDNPDVAMIRAMTKPDLRDAYDQWVLDYVINEMDGHGQNGVYLSKLVRGRTRYRVQPFDHSLAFDGRKSGDVANVTVRDYMAQYGNMPRGLRTILRTAYQEGTLNEQDLWSFAERMEQRLERIDFNDVLQAPDLSDATPGFRRDWNDYLARARQMAETRRINYLSTYDEWVRYITQ